MIYKYPAPNLTHEIFASTPFSKYIKLVHAPTTKKKKKTYLPTLFFLAMLAQWYLIIWVSYNTFHEINHC